MKNKEWQELSEFTSVIIKESAVSKSKNKSLIKIVRDAGLIGEVRKTAHGKIVRFGKDHNAQIDLKPNVNNIVNFDVNLNNT